MTISHAQDSEAVLEHLVTRGEAGRALALLRRPGVSQELSYKFAPALVAAAPAEAVDAWMAAQPALNPRHVLSTPWHARFDASCRICASPALPLGLMILSHPHSTQCLHIHT